ncbi:hypothetical protein ACQPZQ_02495 [Pseudonocardia sp. CA-142604]|uniref:hypothetical protein n=1 Tax=Pseudonocardia sp. CA-142604 TaxID=3240024 RepID=UPI003D906282
MTLTFVNSRLSREPASPCSAPACTGETAVLAGDVDHRDSLLTDKEKAANDTMFIWVSRAACPMLVLDL